MRRRLISFAWIGAFLVLAFIPGTPPALRSLHLLAAALSIIVEIGDIITDRRLARLQREGEEMIQHLADLRAGRGLIPPREIPADRIGLGMLWLFAAPAIGLGFFGGDPALSAMLLVLAGAAALDPPS